MRRYDRIGEVIRTEWGAYLVTLDGEMLRSVLGLPFSGPVDFTIRTAAASIDKARAAARALGGEYGLTTRLATRDTQTPKWWVMGRPR